MAQSPLADRLRPKKLSEFVGQKHLVGQDGIITRLLGSSVADHSFPSLILWGPPGSGKTTLARIIARELDREFFEFSAVDTSVKEISKILKSQNHNSSFIIHDSAKSPIIFIDELHRFNKSQQSRLLPYVERGEILLIGATTENPSFEIIGPLLSRTRVLILAQLGTKELKKIVKRGLREIKRALDKKAEDFLIESSNGDARILLNTLEIAASLSTGHRLLSTDHISQALQKSQLIFDKKGEEYYNVISAFIKSMRASDVDAALYYLARMVEAGQDPLYIARRMVVFASEDVASPTALVVANEVFRACETIGYPECQENLAAGVVYLSLAKKDRSAYNAYMEALSDVRKFGNLPVPLKIRNPVTKLMKEVGYGKGYVMYPKDPPATPEHSDGGRGSLLPEKLKGKKYYKRSS